MTVSKTEKVIYELELSLMSSEVRNSAERIKDILSEDFFEFGSSGKRYKYSAGDVFDTQYTYSVEDFKVTQIGEDCALATYRAVRTKEDLEIDCTLRSSLWRRENGMWKMLFHQGTPAKC